MSISTTILQRKLRLDLGTSLGWAIDDGRSITSGTVSFANRRFEGGGMRYLRFERWLAETHVTTLFGEVAFEEVHRHRGTDAAHVYGGLLAVLTKWCEQNAIPYEGVPVSAIKREATGKGGGKGTDKDAIVVAMRARGHEPANDDEADAIALAYALRKSA